MKRFDVMVLGAGMVGISTAIALQARGRQVVLIDRRGPAEETSFGNAGLIQAEAVMPYAFPRSLSTILGVLAGRRTDARIAWRALRHTAPWLWRYARASAPNKVMATARANAPLIARAVPEHEALSQRAGALHMWHRDGYLRLHRSARGLEAAAAQDARVRARFGIPYEVWDGATLKAAEPHLSGALYGAIHMPAPVRILDPGDLGALYADLFAAEGGTILTGDAMTLRGEGPFTVSAQGDEVIAREAVIALGPWSGDLLARFGARVPLGVKRGYHQHYGMVGNTVLNHLVVDEARGFVMTQNRRGIRLTTGAEFDRRDAPSTPVQLGKVEPLARELLMLGPRVGEPWRGARPALPDLLPVIGPIPGYAGLWANFGHHHLGFTLGPATGRLVAEMLTGEAPFTDPGPYRIERF